MARHEALSTVRVMGPFLVHHPRQVRDQTVGDAVLLDPAREDDQHIASAPGRVHDRGIVVYDLADPPRLVRHASTGWEPRRDPLVEFLPAEDGEHLGAR